MRSRLSRSLPAGFVFRAKLILMLAEGVPFAAIKERLQTTAPTISRWKQRFLKDGLEGLDAYHPGQPAGPSDAGAAGEDPGRDTQKTARWFDSLELPQTGGGDQRELRIWCIAYGRKPG
jgi:hypothetical protein